MVTEAAMMRRGVSECEAMGDKPLPAASIAAQPNLLVNAAALSEER